MGKNFHEFTFQKRVGYSQDMSLYGMDFQIYILKPEMAMVSQMMNSFPVLIISLILVNVILPFNKIKDFSIVRKIWNLHRKYQSKSIRKQY